MRLDFDTLAPGFSKALGRLDAASGEGPLDRPLRELVPYFTERERAALALIEAVTVPTRAGVPDDVWADAAKVFDEAALAQLLATVVTVNAWNRIGVPARCWTPGSYQP